MRSLRLMLSMENGLKCTLKMNVKVFSICLVVILFLLAPPFILSAHCADINQRNNPANSQAVKRHHLCDKLFADLAIFHVNLYRLQRMGATGADMLEINKLSNKQIYIMNEDITLLKKTLASPLPWEEKKFYQNIMDNFLTYQQASLKVIRLAPAGTGAAYLALAQENFESLINLLTQLSDYYWSNHCENFR